MQEGGIRLKPKLSRQYVENKPVISIITVVYNSEKWIEKTIQSIINQSYVNIEYIVVDGDSEDQTVEIIKKYTDYIDYWVSEFDNGLYDAMNKGLNLATGDYVWFINSGDLIYSLTSLNQILSKETSFADFYYGETLLIDENEKPIGMRRHKAPQELNWMSFAKGMKVSHQAMIVKKEIVQPYVLKYNYSADYDWAVKALKRAETIKNTNLVLAKFMDGGMTSQYLFPSLKERFSIMKRHYGWLRTLFNHFLMVFKLSFFYLKNKYFHMSWHFFQIKNLSYPSLQRVKKKH